MKNSVKILIFLIFMIYANNFTAYADMNLEVSASVSGMSVALNNFYARNISPEEQLVKTVRKAANSAREEEFALNHVNDLVKRSGRKKKVLS